MSRQIDLFGAPTPAPRHRLFFALFPNDRERERIAAIAGALHDGMPRARWIRPQRYHLTLHYLGESEGRREDLIARALDAAAGFHADAFAVELDHLRALGNPRRPALALAASRVPAELERFWRGLQERLIRAGALRQAGRGFVPHLTLAYVDPEPALATVAPVVLRPGEFHLIHSVEGQADYETLGRWPVGGGDTEPA